MSSDTGPPRISHSRHACNCLFHKKKHYLAANVASRG